MGPDYGTGPNTRYLPLILKASRSGTISFIDEETESCQGLATEIASS